MNDSQQHKTAIIGLGVMGQRMLGNMHQYPGFEAVMAWDPDADACRRTAKRYPGMRIAATAAEAIEAADIACVYVACPPQYHAEHALAAFAAGKSVWCEKPLGVEPDSSAQMVAAAERSGQVHIVNFSLASAVATTEFERLRDAGVFGTIQSIDLRLHFATWPRDWQMAASDWLAYRHEGGFTREVVSHWVYLTRRLFGTAALEYSRCRYPGGELAETHLQAMLSVGEVPFSIAASTGGVGPDIVEYTVRGDAQGYRIQDWNVPFVSDGQHWTRVCEDVPDPREAGYEAQLANAARAISSQPHTMPDFGEALGVQQTVEAMLRDD